MARIGVVAAAAGVMGIAAAIPARAAEPVMVQCGREYQAAKAAGTLNGMDWSAYRAACAARLRSAPAAAAAGPAAQPAAAAQPPDPASAPPAAPPASGTATVTGGMAAMHARQKQCGAEWRADKAVLTARTPGLTWPTYWSQCNTRLKAAGG